MTAAPLSFWSRLAFAFACFFRILFDGAFAARLHAAANSSQAPPASVPPLPEQLAAPKPALDAARVAGAARVEGALQLLGLLQREGRLVDFLQQDVSAFPDADVGAAARVVHEGCRRALAAHAKVVSVRSEAEGAAVSVDEREVASVNLVGNVTGSAPYRGVLRHRGWRLEGFKLPLHVGGEELSVVARAEVEL